MLSTLARARQVGPRWARRRSGGLSRRLSGRAYVIGRRACADTGIQPPMALPQPLAAVARRQIARDAGARLGARRPAARAVSAFGAWSSRRRRECATPRRLRCLPPVPGSRRTAAPCRTLRTTTTPPTRRGRAMRGNSCPSCEKRSARNLPPRIIPAIADTSTMRASAPRRGCLVLSHRIGNSHAAAPARGEWAGLYCHP